MGQNINSIKGTPRAIGDQVLVTDMHFGEQVTESGLIIANDDGQTRGIYPRWARVYSKGPDNKDEFKVGDWILVSHGRWTRGLSMETSTGEIEIRKVELESILATSTEKPDGLQIGAEYSDGEHATVDPSSFINA
jgi:co-chaperonin GroES (HSP10)|tara:strand:+ start:434 stop:838 length:405 start_codon:yes stop_codon:yes gene_type:complete